MSKKIKILRLVAVFAVFALFGILFAVNGVYTFSYREGLGTFFYTSAFVKGTLFAPGGLAALAGAFVTQFFANPWLGAVIMTAILACISCLTSRLIVRISGKKALWPLGVVPTVALAYLCYNVNYSLAGTMGILMILPLLLAILPTEARSLKSWQTAAGAVAYTVLLSLCCGAVAMLYASLVCLIIVITQLPKYYRDKRALTALVGGSVICPVVALLMGMWYVDAGYYGDVWRALTPEAYFTLRLQPGMFVNMPWILMMAVVALACLLAWVRIGRKMGIALAAVVAVGAVTFASVGSMSFVERQTEQFKQMQYHMYRGEWQQVIDLNAGHQVTNILHQNCLNMALAESGRLGDELFRNPCIDIRSIYIEGEKTPYMQMLLSDIYWSMGHIALAQRNAFEANESLDNVSPRMLMRLAQTNIANGSDAVAEKYINLLEHTLYYKDEASRLRGMLGDRAAVAADSVLGPKSRCIFPDNRFSASRGLDDDLRNVLRANPDHTVTLQYLGSLYLLSKDVDSFADVVSEFVGTDSIGAQLPLYFQEGMLTRYPQQADSVAERYHIPEATMARFRANDTATTTFWYYYRYKL